MVSRTPLPSPAYESSRPSPIYIIPGNNSNIMASHEDLDAHHQPTTSASTRSIWLTATVGARSAVRASDAKKVGGGTQIQSLAVKPVLSAGRAAFRPGSTALRHTHPRRTTTHPSRTPPFVSRPRILVGPRADLLPSSRTEQPFGGSSSRAVSEEPAVRVKAASSLGYSTAQGEPSPRPSFDPVPHAEDPFTTQEEGRQRRRRG